MIYELRSDIRDGRSELISHFQKRGLSCHILSGDSPGPTLDVALQVGICEANCSLLTESSRQAGLRKQSWIATRAILWWRDWRCNWCCTSRYGSADRRDSFKHHSYIRKRCSFERASREFALHSRNLQRTHNRMIVRFVWTALYKVFAILLAEGAFVSFRVAPAYAGMRWDH